MKSKKLLLGILIGISTLFIAAEYGRMEVNGLLKVDTIQHNKNASGVYIEDVQFLNNVIRANAFYVGETELVNGGAVSSVFGKTGAVANISDAAGYLKMTDLADLLTTILPAVEMLQALQVPQMAMLLFSMG